MLTSMLSRSKFTICLILSSLTGSLLWSAWPPSPVVDTGQEICFDELEPIRPPKEGRNFFGQDAQYFGVSALYKDNGDGTVTDERTGLIWSQATSAKKLTLAEAETEVKNMTLAGYDDWRLPTTKELYSLIDFRGITGMPDRRGEQSRPDNAIPYINTDYFEFRYGDTDAGERFIDAQWLTSTINVSPVMHGKRGLFGVNFADGRIKCYPATDTRRGEKKFYVRYVRGREDYGQNQFEDNGDGTVTDKATGLIWMKADSTKGMRWKDALEYAEQVELGGRNDWRLPNAKELQSIVDYSRSPDSTNSAAIDPIFAVSTITNEAGEEDYPYFWTSTTHVDGPNASQAVYITFGRAIGQMHGQTMDVHGAGAQRSDPKNGEARLGHGPQGDAQRILNYVRCVAGGAVADSKVELPQTTKQSAYPNRIRLADTTYNPEKMEYREMPEHGDPGQGQQQQPQGNERGHGHPPHHHFGPPPPRR